jgi:hypothetical protein
MVRAGRDWVVPGKGGAVSNKPKRPVLSLKPKGGKQATPGAAEAPEKPQAPRQPPRVPGPAYTPPHAHEPFLEHFWLVMRSNGRRPKVRHLTLEEAREEAQRIAAKNPACDCWVIECRTVETVRSDAATTQDAAGASQALGA